MVCLPVRSSSGTDEEARSSDVVDSQAALEDSGCMLDVAKPCLSLSAWSLLDRDSPHARSMHALVFAFLTVLFGSAQTPHLHASLSLFFRAAPQARASRKEDISHVYYMSSVLCRFLWWSMSSHCLCAATCQAAMTSVFSAMSVGLKKTHGVMDGLGSLHVFTGHTYRQMTFQCHPFQRANFNFSPHTHVVNQ